MILRLVVYVVAFLIPVVMAARAVYRAKVAPRLRAARARRRARLDEMLVCCFCGKPVDTDVDFLIRSSWSHRACVQKILSE